MVHIGGIELNIEQAKCLALYRLIKHFGEAALLRELPHMNVSTICRGSIVEVHFFHDDQKSGFSLHVSVNSETGESITRDQP